MPKSKSLKMPKRSALNLRPDPHNARKHNERNQKMIRQSLEEVGGFRSIAVDGDGIVRAGNGVFEQAQALGMKVRVVDARPDEVIAVRRADLKGKKAVRAAILDNRAGELSEWDLDVLAATPDDLLAGLWDERELKAMGMNGDGNADAEPQIDRAAELNEKWQVKRGDLFAVGDHRLLCGDCTVRADVERVMGGEKAGACVTDPPYNYDYDYGDTEDDKPLEQFLTFTNQWLELIRFFSSVRVITPGLKNLSLFVRQHEPTWICAWVKRNAMTASAIGQLSVWEPIIFETDDYDWEPVIVFGKPKKKVVRDVYDFPTRVQSGVANHPCPKLLEFWQRLISDYSRSGDTVLDVFIGSGTTLVACQNLNRRGRGIEISPGYVAVTLERMSTAFPGISIELLK